MNETIHIVITGPESSGKTVLANFLAESYDAILIEEYARAYLEKYGPEYERSDLRKIAFHQLQKQLEAQCQDAPLVISDTDLLTIDIWDQWKYGQSDDFILEWLGLQQVDHYLLCYPDIPWEYDVLRESEHDREKIFQIYKQRIEELGISYSIIQGIKDVRENRAIQYINQSINHFKENNE